MSSTLCVTLGRIPQGPPLRLQSRDQLQQKVSGLFFVSHIRCTIQPQPHDFSPIDSGLFSGPSERPPSTGTKLTCLSVTTHRTATPTALAKPSEPLKHLPRISLSKHRPNCLYLSSAILVSLLLPSHTSSADSDDSVDSGAPCRLFRSTVGVTYAGHWRTGRTTTWLPFECTG
jgi:hypothetical protein